MNYQLVKVFGIQRSGNHAVINWLLGLQDDSLFFNFVNPEKAMLDNRHGVSVPEGAKAYCTKDEHGSYVHHGNVDNFKKHGGRLLCSYENLSKKTIIDKNVDRNIDEFFGKPYERINILLLRNPFNMMVSSEKLLSKIKHNKKRSEKWYNNELERRLILWLDYANHYSFLDGSSCNEWVSILFDNFVIDKEYRDKVSRRIGNKNEDKNLDYVSNAGKGSSFDSLIIDNKNDLLDRWHLSNGDSLRLFLKYPEAMKLAEKIFGTSAIPSELR